MKLSNQHPVDELAIIRAEIKALEQREAVLRAALLAADADLTGEAFRARVVTTTQWKLSRELLQHHYGSAAVKKCSLPMNITAVRLYPNRRQRPSSSMAAAPAQNQSIPTSNTWGV